MGEGVSTIRSATKTNRSYLHDTDSGMNRQEAFRVNQLESKIRGRKTEKGYIVGSDGNVIAESAKSGKRSAKFYISDLMKAKDAILTHNHPTDELYGSIAGRVGNPFSSADLQRVTEYNMKEIRAVTPTYTFSIRRPKEGWGDQRKINQMLSRLAMDAQTGYERYTAKPVRDFLANRSIENERRLKEAHDRGNVGVQWSNLRKLAKEMGWQVTRKKVK